MHTTAIIYSDSSVIHDKFFLEDKGIFCYEGQTITFIKRSTLPQAVQEFCLDSEIITLINSPLVGKVNLTPTKDDTSILQNRSCIVINKPIADDTHIISPCTIFVNAPVGKNVTFEIQAGNIFFLQSYGKNLSVIIRDEDFTLAPISGSAFNNCWKKVVFKTIGSTPKVIGPEDNTVFSDPQNPSYFLVVLPSHKPYFKNFMSNKSYGAADLVAVEDLIVNTIKQEITNYLKLHPKKSLTFFQSKPRQVAKFKFDCKIL